MKLRVVAALAVVGLAASVVATEGESHARGTLLGRFETKAKDPKGGAKPADKDKGSSAPGELKKRFGLAPRGLAWGLGNDAIAKIYDKIFDEQYVPLYQKVQPGPRMQALDAELAQKKALIRDSLLEFGAVPTGLDNSPLQGEYSYRNKESMSTVEVGKITRRFFFFDNRLWKVYDEYRLKKDGPLGATFEDATKILTKKFGVAPVMVEADFSKNQNYREAVWHDSATIYRAVDREGEKVLGLVYVDKSVQDNLGRYRTTKATNPNAMDKDVAAVTRPSEDDAPPPPPKAGDKKKKPPKR